MNTVKCWDCGGEFPPGDTFLVQRETGRANTLHWSGGQSGFSNTVFTQEVTVCGRCHRIATDAANAFYMKILWWFLAGTAVFVLFAILLIRSMVRH
jgi:hypothetical protein